MSIMSSQGQSLLSHFYPGFVCFVLILGPDIRPLDLLTDLVTLILYLSFFFCAESVFLGLEFVLERYILVKIWN